MTNQSPGQPTVGVVGLGNMGGLIAQCIVRAGFPTIGYDLRRDAVEQLEQHGGQGAESIEDLLRRVDIVSVVVVNEAQVREVASVRAALPTGAGTFIVNSTVTPLFVSNLEKELGECGVAVIDAAVAGGLARARTGQLTVTVGGPDAVVERVRPVLSAFGKDIFHVGAAGGGSAMKLVVNFLTIAGYALQLEAVQLASGYGLSEDTAMEVLVTSNADSRAIHTWGVQDRTRRGVPAGTAPVAELMVKDLTSATLAAAARGIVLPMASVAAATMARKIAQRDADLDQVGWSADTPRCSACGIELAAPFRAAGVHPECRGA